MACVNMEPRVDAVNTRGNTLYFRVSGINVSLANALRRVILAEIPCVVLNADAEEDIEIERNTTRLNNELIRQRLCCVPVHVTDTAIGDHQVELDVENTGDTVMMATTRNFRVKNRATDTYLTDKATKAMFPPDPITGDFIDLVRLRPAQTNGGNEAITLHCRLGVSTASENASFGVAATCSYAATQDVAASDAAWEEKKPDTADPDALQMAKTDWDLLGAKRYVVPDSFDFVVETVGQFSNEQLLVRACEIMVDKLKRFAVLDAGHVSVAPSQGTMENAYTATMRGEGYTLGKVVESVLLLTHVRGQAGSDGTIVYCGFRKPHPHVDVSELRLAFATKSSLESARGVLTAAALRAATVFESLSTMFGASEGERKAS